MGHPSIRSIRTLGQEALVERNDRVDLNVEVEQGESMAPGSYNAVNISDGGICLRSATPEQIGSLVALNFPLGDPSIGLYAEVMWCRADRNGHKIGLRFVVIDQRERNLINDFVRTHSQDGPENA